MIGLFTKLFYSKFVGVMGFSSLILIFGSEFELSL